MRSKSPAIGKVATAPRRAGRAEACSPKPNALGFGRQVGAAEVEADLREAGVAADAQQVGDACRRTRCRRSWAGPCRVRGRSSCCRRGYVLRGQVGGVVERGGRGDHLERRAGRDTTRGRPAATAAAPGRSASAFHALRTSSCLCAASGVGSNVGKLTMASIAPLVGSSATTAPRRFAERLGRRALHGGVDRERDVGGLLTRARTGRAGSVAAAAACRR